MAIAQNSSCAVVVHVITGLGRGGAENALYRLVSHSDGLDSVKVVSLTDGGVFKDRLERLGVEVVCLNMGSAVVAPWAVVRLIGLLRKWRPNLVQTWMYHADLLAGLAARFAGVRVCWGIRNSDLSPTHSKMTTRFVARLCALLSSFIPAAAISCSSRAAEIHKALGYAVPFEVIPNGLPLESWSPDRVGRDLSRKWLGVSNSEFVFAHIGRGHPQKDHENLARAFTQAHAKRPLLRLVLCGESLVLGSPYFDALPFGHAARAAVMAIGPRDDVPRLLQGVDGFVLSSAFGEAFPNVVVEAMASALPCVVTDVGDSAMIVGETGLVVPPGDSDLLGGALVALADMSLETRMALGQKARQRVLENFSMGRMVEGYQRVWRALHKKD